MESLGSQGTRFSIIEAKKKDDEEEEKKKEETQSASI